MMWTSAVVQARTALARRARLSTTATASEAAAQVAERKCLACGQPGHHARDCPNVSAEQRKKNAQDFFREGRCLVCGEVGHAAKACPKLGLSTEYVKPIEPKHERPSLEVRNAEKLCFQCGAKGHVMRDCPVEPYTRKIKGISKRYSGSRLQKMLPAVLKEEKELAPAHKSLSNSKPKLGVVVATNSEKTIAVLIPRTVLHPLFKIPLDRSQKIMVHDEEQRAVCGDVVVVQHTRPISKKKHHALTEIVLSLNERKAVMAGRMDAVKRNYEGIDEAALEELAQKQKLYQERMSARQAKEESYYADEKQKINAEIQQRMKDLNSVLQEAESEVENKNEKWLEAMRKTVEESDKAAQSILDGGHQLGQKLDILSSKDDLSKDGSKGKKD